MKCSWKVLLVCISIPIAGFSQELHPSADSTSQLRDPKALPAKQDSVNPFPNSLEVGYRFESYNKNYNDRTFLYVQYGRTIKQVDVLARVLRYTLGNFEGYQFEGEAYWKFKRNGYSYFDVAYSDAFILPNYRIRAELFQMANRFEYSLGAGIVKPFNFDNIPVITGTLGYYFGDYFVYVRPTFSYVEGGFTKAIFIQGRRYFTKTDFIALSMLRGADTGASRDVNSTANTFGNDTYLIRFSGKVATGRFKIGAGLDFGGLFIPERKEFAQFVGFDIFINRQF